jgi:hypothetical protein
MKTSCGFGSMALIEAELTSEPRINNMEIKAGFTQAHNWGQTAKILATVTLPTPMEKNPPPSAMVPSKKVLNLTRYMDDAGKLNYKFPRGKWTVLRLGYTATGEHIIPATQEGRGLECDKLDPDVINFQLESLVGELVKELGPIVGTGYNGVWLDSWEAHGQNWTGILPKEFKKRRGYDLIPYLPLIANGQIIDSVEVSERVLWDFRRTIADMIRENFYATIRKWVHKRGLQLNGEFAGQAAFMYDPINFMMEADTPVGEFWSLTSYGGRDLQVASSIAHTLGKTVTVGAEAYTGWGGYQTFPYKLKSLGDESFCAGANRFYIHTSSHQSLINPSPGMTFGPWGIDFHRGNTWFEMSKEWIDYVTRCQQMLREGKFVADICYYIGDDAPVFVGSREAVWKPIPEGRNFDTINTDILKMLTVKDGKLVLPSGMRYHALLLPNRDAMLPDSLKIIEALVRQGAVVAGPPPTHSPTLKNYQKSDKRVLGMARKMWGKKACATRQTGLDAVYKVDRKVGKGRVTWGLSWDEIFKTVKPIEDFSAKVSNPEAKIGWYHRRTEDADIYFVASQKYEAVDAICSFRVEGRVPELWNPDTGKQRKAAVYTQADGTTKLPIHFDPAGSVFVIFRNKPDGSQFISVTRDGQTLFDANQQVVVSMPKLGYDKDGEIVFEQGDPGVYTFTQANGNVKTVKVDKVGETKAVTGPWQLSFQKGRGAPDNATLDKLTDLSENNDEGIKYFSGTVAYSSSFDLTEATAKSDKRITIDLGDISVIAEVIVNDKNVGITWKKPYRLDITDAVKPGKNQLTVKVANLWVNRLVGDEQYPDDCVWKPYGGNFSMDKWPDWYLNNEPRPTERMTFFPYKHHSKGKALPKSGLLGPVKITVIPKLKM